LYTFLKNSKKLYPIKNAMIRNPKRNGTAIKIKVLTIPKNLRKASLPKIILINKSIIK
jgi:hypothetical protein